MSDAPQEPVDSHNDPPVVNMEMKGVGFPDKDECNMAMLAHLLGALVGFIGPLIIWLIKKDEYAFVDDQGKEAVNFQISIVIYAIVSFVLTLILIGFLLLLAVIVFNIVCIIKAALKANNGERYRYPMSIRIIK